MIQKPLHSTSAQQDSKRPLDKSINENALTGTDDVGNLGTKAGYKNPPTHSRFKPGRSGNPKGRPKGSRNIVNELQDFLSEKITVQQGKKTKRMSRMGAAVAKTFENAVKGNPRAVDTLLRLVSRFASPKEMPETSQYDLSLLSDEELSQLEKILFKAGGGSLPNG
jgi:hypothetical protein